MLKEESAPGKCQPGQVLTVCQSCPSLAFLLKLEKYWFWDFSGGPVAKLRAPSAGV